MKDVSETALKKYATTRQRIYNCGYRHLLWKHKWNSWLVIMEAQKKYFGLAAGPAYRGGGQVEEGGNDGVQGIQRPGPRLYLVALATQTHQGQYWECQRSGLRTIFTHGLEFCLILPEQHHAENHCCGSGTSGSFINWPPGSESMNPESGYGSLQLTKDLKKIKEKAQYFIIFNYLLPYLFGNIFFSLAQKCPDRIRNIYLRIRNTTKK